MTKKREEKENMRKRKKTYTTMKGERKITYMVGNKVEKIKYKKELSKNQINGQTGNR